MFADCVLIVNALLGMGVISYVRGTTGVLGMTFDIIHVCEIEVFVAFGITDNPITAYGSLTPASRLGVAVADSDGSVVVGFSEIDSAVFPDYLFHAARPRRNIPSIVGVSIAMTRCIVPAIRGGTLRPRTSTE